MAVSLDLAEGLGPFAEVEALAEAEADLAGAQEPWSRWPASWAWPRSSPGRTSGCSWKPGGSLAGIRLARLEPIR